MTSSVANFRAESLADDPCPSCQGRGWKMYPMRVRNYEDTSYKGVCDACWGTKCVIRPVSASELEEVLTARCAEAKAEAVD